MNSIHVVDVLVSQILTICIHKPRPLYLLNFPREIQRVSSPSSSVIVVLSTMGRLTSFALTIHATRHLITLILESEVQCARARVTERTRQT